MSKTSAVKGRHGMKGIIGAERAKTYKASTYVGGDNGGSAGGFGLSHGAGGGGVPETHDTPPQRYSGRDLGFEGGVRAGGDFETMPAQYTVKKQGKDFDHHGQTMAESVHGVAGVEGMPKSNGGHGMVTAADKGYQCAHGCGYNAKTGHGLARHMHSKHGGFAGIGKALTHGFKMKAAGQVMTTQVGKREYVDESRGMAGCGGKAGCGGSTSTMKHGSYNHDFKGHGTSQEGDSEYFGETEGTEEMGKIRAEYKRAKSKIGSVTTEQQCSSYSKGDCGGSHGLAD